MLPMYLARSSTGSIRDAVPTTVSAPDCAGQIPVIQRAAPVAIDFWQQVAESNVSSRVRDVAESNVAVIRRSQLALLLDPCRSRGLSDADGRGTHQSPD